MSTLSTCSTNLSNKKTFECMTYNFIRELLQRRASIDINDISTREKLTKNLFKNLNIFLFVLVSSIFIYYAATDKDALSKKTYVYGLLIILPLAFGIYSSTKLFNDGDEESSSRFLMFGGALFAIAILGYFYSNASGSTLLIMNYVINILMVLIIIGGLAIFYFVFSNYLKKQTGALGYIINFIFYIPCLFLDLVKYLKGQMGITPSSVFVLFIIEIFLLILYFIVPKISDYLIQGNSNLLLNKPIFLNMEEVVADSSKFIIKNNKLRNPSLDNSVDYRNSNYCVSFWCYVNTGSASDSAYNQESNIFNYADGKPKVVYISNGKDHKDKYIVYFTNNDETENVEQTRYELTLPSQRWNYFAFNYYDNHADLFVNGKLERTFEFTSNNIPRNGSESDTIVVGSHTGLNGAICNVNYYTDILPSSQISNNYNLLMFKNPPILG